MKTLAKVALGLVGVLAVLFVALIVVVTLILDPNDYRPYIVNAVQEATGRPFELEGDLGLNVLPCCSVSLGPSRLGSPEGFPEQSFASLESAALSISIWPLLTQGEVEVGTVTLEGMDVTLVRLADGTVNWEFASEEEAASAPDTPAGEAAPMALSVERVVLRDGRVRYRDEQAGQDYALSGLELDTQLAMAGDRITVTSPRLSLAAAGSDLPDDVTVNVSAGTLVAVLGEQAEITLDTFTVDARTLDSRVRMSGGGRAGADLELRGDFTLEETSARDLLAALADQPYLPADETALQRLAARGRWVLGSNRLSVEELAVQLDDSTLSGSAAVEDFDTGAARFDLALDRIDLDRYLAAPAPNDTTGAATSTPPAEPTEIPLALLADMPVDGTVRIGTLRASGVGVNDVVLSLASQAGEVTTRLEARALGGTVNLDGRGNVAGAAPRLAGTVRVQGLQPRSLLAALDSTVETAAPNVLKRLDGQADWYLTPRSAGLENARWTLDDTTLTGNVRVDDFDHLTSRFDLAVDRMNLDAYLPPESAQAPGAPAEQSDTEIPLELVRALNLSGRLRATELVLLDMTLRDVLAQVDAADGVLRLDPLSASLYGGSYRGSAVIDATGSRANLTLDQKLAAVQVDEILQGFFNSNVLGGSLSFQLAGSGQGNTTSELLRGLAANVSFDLSDGVYRGANLLYQVQRARALLKNEPAPAPPESPVTPIRTLKASGRMVDGVLQTNQLSAETDALRLLGQGGINLMELALDYKLNAEVLGAAASAAKLGDLANATIPLTIAGPLTAPKVGVDLKGALTNTVRDTLQNKAREALRKRLGDDDASGGDSPSGAAQATPGTSDDSAEPAPAKEPSAKDLLKRGLRDLLKPREEEPPEDEKPPDGAR